MNKIKSNNKVTALEKEKRKTVLKRYLMIAITVAIVCVAMVPVLAESDAEKAIKNMSDIIFGIIRAIGVILAGWGLVQVGMSFQSHDPSQRSQGFLCLAGGLIIVFAKSILTAQLGMSLCRVFSTLATSSIKCGPSLQLHRKTSKVAASGA